MRVVHVTPFYHPVVGGVERVARKICEYLTNSGYDVYVLTYNRMREGGKGSLPRTEEINGVKVIRLKPSFTWSHGTYSPELQSTLMDLRPDLVHVHVWRHPHVFQVIKLKEKMKFKAILHTHAPFHTIGQLGVITWFYHRSVDLLLKGYLRKYDAVVSLTPQERALLMRKFGADSVVIPNGIEKRHIKWSRKGDYVLYTGRMAKAKNLDLLIKAMEYVKAPLKLVGPDEGYVKRILDLARELRADVEWLGVVSEDELDRAYSGSALLAHPAHYEPFGITLLEAQAHGKPCVITGWGGQLYAAPPLKTSLYARPDPREMGITINRLLEDQELYQRLSRNAFEWAKKHVWDNILPRYVDLYEGRTRSS